MRVREFQSEIWLPLPPAELFSFFCDAANLNALTPPWLHFQIVTPQPIEMRAGVLIDYKLRVRGFPLRWRTIIRHWQPPLCFADEQLRGPYRQWIHTHTFEPRDGGTLARDTVQYAVWLDFIVHPLFVRQDIQKIFAFRQVALREKFGSKA
jgi:ligand-binding SRPBCC domain-containing protein